MTNTTFAAAPRDLVALVAAALLLTVAGCSSKGAEGDKECVDPPPEAVEQAKKTVQIERFGLGKAGDENKADKDWCRACVMSLKGYASCQRVYAQSPDEGRDSLRARARVKACLDAGYPKEACPDKAVINLLCLGDDLPPGTPDPGTALQNLFKSMGGGQPEKGAPAAGAGAEPEVKPEATPEVKPEAKPRTGASETPQVE